MKRNIGPITIVLLYLTFLTSSVRSAVRSGGSLSFCWEHPFLVSAFAPITPSYTTFPGILKYICTVRVIKLMERVSAAIQSQPAKFFAVAVVASFATLQAHALYTGLCAQSKKEKLNRELQELYREDFLLANGHDKRVIKEDGEETSVASALSRGVAIASSIPLSVGGFDDSLIREQLARNYAFFGEEGMSKIRNATVVIVGCGGVGSWAAMMLARTYVSNFAITRDELTRYRGVSKLRLIDFDYVTLSSLNRHATATRADVGIPKVQSLKQMIANVVPWVQVETCVELWNVENEKENGWLEGADWIVDAIDNITTKVSARNITASIITE